MPEDVRASLRAMASGSREPAVRGWRTLVSPWPAASLVAAGLLVVVGILSLRPEPARISSVDRVQESPARVDDASGAADGERKEASQQPESPPPASARPEAETRQTAPGRKDRARDAQDEIRKSRVRAKTPGEPEGPAAKADQSAGERVAALSKKKAVDLRSLGYVAGDAPPKTMPVGGGTQPDPAFMQEEAVTAPAGLHATTLIVSGDALSFAPLEPRPGGRARPNATDGHEITWRIQTPSFAVANFARAAEAPESDSAASGQSASTAKVQDQLPDPARVLAERRGPGGTIILLLQVDERGLIHEATPVGAQTMEPAVAAAVARLLRGSSLVPYPVGQPAGFQFPLEVTVPPAEAP